MVQETPWRDLYRRRCFSVPPAPPLYLVFFSMAPNKLLKEHRKEHPWRSPDHPPYASMIGEAIGELSDPGGAAASDISDYITSNFNGLPPAHHKLFPFFLRKLVHNKVFAEVSPGRFAIADPESHDDEPPHFVHYHGERKPLAESVNRDLDPKMADREGFQMPPLVKRGRGRPRKRDQGGFQMHTSLLDSVVRDGDLLVKRGRGRSRKRDQEVFQMPTFSRDSARDGDSLAKRGRRRKADEGGFQMPPLLRDSSGDGDLLVKRGRGRPRKRDEGGFQMPPLLCDSARDGDLLVKRGRGRPRKKGQGGFQMPPLLCDSVVRDGDLLVKRRRGRGRKRGRPRKKDEGGFQMPPLLCDSTRDGDLLVKRGRGRPRKRDEGGFQKPPLLFLPAPQGDLVKRGRGRPRKKMEEKLEIALPLENAVKVIKRKQVVDEGGRPEKKKRSIAGGE